MQQEANDHCVEAKGSQFFQFTNDVAALKNKQKRQAFGMTFSARIFRWNDIVSLSLRNVSSSRSDKVPELVKDMSAEVRSKMFSEMITSSVQDQAVKKVSQELDNETDTCDRYQDEKVGSSAV